MNNVYIAEIQSILPKLYTPEEAVDILYPKTVDSGRLNRFAKRVASNVGIQYRPSVLDANQFPLKALAEPSYHPLEWGIEVTDRLLKKVNAKDVGFLSVSYNIRSDKDVLPSLAGRISVECGLDLDYPPEELPYIGCAASLFSVESAVKYCRTHNRAAIVFSFDQCSWIANPTHDMTAPDFKENIRTSLLFSDGAAGLLIIPETMKNNFDGPLIQIDDIKTAFKPGGSLRMEKGRLVLEDSLKDIMPELVRDMILTPMKIDKDSFSEWSIHQGGLPILLRFMEPQILGLNESQIKRSKDLFIRYGNFSSPSSVFILESFFNEKKDIKNIEKDEAVKGVVVSFGAGYFMAGMTYHWIKA